MAYWILSGNDWMDEGLSSIESAHRFHNQDTADIGQEAAWVRASQKGDPLAFNRLVLRWEKSIYNLTLRMLQNRDEAAEATQEVFLSAFKSIGRFRVDAKFSTWLYRIAVNHCISRFRRRPPGHHFSLEDQQAEALNRRLPARESHEQEFLQQEGRSRVRHELTYLSDDQRMAVELKFFQDMTFEEISEITQAPLSTVKSRLYSGLEILKTRLADIGRIL